MGGAYKACFCDHDLATVQPGICRADKADFSVDVGKVHVSGVECLLHEEKYTRRSCFTQPYGGLRCHETAPSLTVPVTSPLAISSTVTAKKADAASGSSES